MSAAAPRGRVALLLFATLLAGAALGVAVDRRIVSADAPAHAEVERDRRDRDERAVIERFADELALTPEQRSAIAPILKDTRTRMREAFDRVRPEYRAIVDSARARIEAVLTPDQVQQYREYLKRDGKKSGEQRDGRRRGGTDHSERPE
ncbi:MAG: hypothetical protein RRA92_09065 [Gemmatimonadota bacterium]|nr:hypothetical protein [Gemmatimonadota bacterium]